MVTDFWANPWLKLLDHLFGGPPKAARGKIWIIFQGTPPKIPKIPPPLTKSVVEKVVTTESVVENFLWWGDSTTDSVVERKILVHICQRGLLLGRKIAAAAGCTSGLSWEKNHSGGGGARCQGTSGFCFLGENKWGPVGFASWEEKMPVVFASWE